MSSFENDPSNCRELAHWMRQPEDHDRLDEMRTGVLHYLGEHLGLRKREPHRWFSDVLLLLSFDENGDQVDRIAGQDLVNVMSARWDWSLFVARRGPFLTCETATLFVENGKHAPRIDEEPRQNVVEWTKQIASAIGSTYVEAKALREWEVSYDEIDPGFYLDHGETGRLPTAFQVLFYE